MTTTVLDWEQILELADRNPPTWEQILTAEEETGLPWGGPDFWLQRAALATQPTTVYRLFDTDDRLLYVGIAGNPGRRFEQHRTDKAWWGDVARIDLEHFATREDALEAERHAITTERPTHNRIHNRPIGATR